MVTGLQETSESLVKDKRSYDLICFDVDGTLVRHPSGLVIWEVLNLKYGGSKEINRFRYQMYCEGRLSYDRWVQLDVSGWIEKGATESGILDAVHEFSLFEGARETVHELKRRGYRLGVISGTLNVVLDTLFADHPFDEVYTNKIFFDRGGKLVRWEATPYDSHGKPEAMRDMARRHGIPLSRTAFVGDGENDEPLLGVAGFFAAFRPRSRALADGADVVLGEAELPRLLDVFE